MAARAASLVSSSEKDSTSVVSFSSVWSKDKRQLAARSGLSRENKHQPGEGKW